MKSIIIACNLRRQISADVRNSLQITNEVQPAMKKFPLHHICTSIYPRPQPKTNSYEVQEEATITLLPSMLTIFIQFCTSIFKPRNPKHFVESSRACEREASRSEAQQNPTAMNFTTFSVLHLKSSSEIARKNTSCSAKECDERVRKCTRMFWEMLLRSCDGILSQA